jgi:trigger factor
LRRRKVIETQLSQRDAMLLALAELVSESDVPASLVEAETQERLHELGHRLSQQNLDFEMFLQVTNQSPETLLETLRADATRAVRVDLALRGVVAAQGLAATDDDIAEELDRTAESMGVKVETLRENLYDSGRVVAFEAEVAKMKASRWLQENLIFIDENGATIDKALLAMDQSQGLDG